MAIPKHPPSAPRFSVPNRFPELPQLGDISDDDNAKLQKWYEDFLNVLASQFTLVTTEVDKKANAP